MTRRILPLPNLLCSQPPSLLQLSEVLTFQIPGYGALEGNSYEIAINATDAHVMKRAWGVGRNGYAMKGAQVDGKAKALYLHRVILGLSDSKMVVDHIDGNPLNNSRNNLRVCTQAENCRNVRPRLGTSSKYKGVCFSKRDGKWKAYIKLNQKCINLGYFQSELDAAIAYNEACIRFHGEFARPNILSENV